MKDKQNPQADEKTQKVTTTVPHLREIKGLLDSVVAKLESMPTNQGRAIWKNVINTVRDDVRKYEEKLLEGVPGMSTVARS